ncbi:MarR family EPS-associated transcriptional regulator [Roseateles sp. DAIF2]|uniref:MarR family EPS-associated transcriptional regulator n=1 Tax=Roseateles sp. DAIF2 TaxID=2714952 RepID=UPI0018A313CC|nr:MarR family EPS-associated transcriptional regulator [Roseateles sp. DAIF2]QPF72746.1 MarR family EPS-associated transcriptional regulator [Roseateles sp. DAIF2]
MNTPPQPSGKLDYELLCALDSRDYTSQRLLADRLGVSVGKINYCLRAVVDRGWVKVNNFRRADNKWAYAYLLTPSGMSAKLQLARAFLEQKEHEYAQLQWEIQALRDAVSPAESQDMPPPPQEQGEPS